MEEAHYLMNTAQALQIALFNEIRGRDFYLQVAETSPDANVRWQAQEMVEEEAWHVKMLEEWLQEVEVGGGGGGDPAGGSRSAKQPGVGWGQCSTLAPQRLLLAPF